MDPCSTKKERRKKEERDGGKEGRRENGKQMEKLEAYVQEPSGNEEGRGPDSVHGLLLSQSSGPGHLNSPLLILLFA